MERLGESKLGYVQEAARPNPFRRRPSPFRPSIPQKNIPLSPLLPNPNPNLVPRPDRLTPKRKAA